LDAVLLVLRLAGSGSALARPVGTGIVLAVTVLMMAYGVFHARNIRTVHYEIALKKDVPGSAGQLRIVLVTDLHMGSIVDRKWLAGIVDAILASSPDIIFLGGDVFDNNLDTMPDPEGMKAELRRLDAPLGVFAVPGNDDVDRLSFHGPVTLDRIHAFLESVDIVLLQDEVRLIADRFYLIGRRDARPIGGGQARKSAAELSAGLDRSKPLIFLDHQPVDYQREEEAGADLILSGHTHRGQFFPGNIATAYIYKKAGGVHYGLWQGSTAQAIVSSGAGVWGIPLRIATNSEAVVLDLTFGNWTSFAGCL
jgi:predicted MPP superfamily phosphohydrolase